MDRRCFLKNSLALTALPGFVEEKRIASMTQKPKDIRVISTDSNFEREPLSRPFGFKGGYLTELWQTAVQLNTAGHSQIGLATQSVLYGDAHLFEQYSEAGGNALMYAMTERALKLVKKTPFHTPIDLLDKILPQLEKEAPALTGLPEVNINFIFNALIGIDNAAWLLYAAENNLEDFDAMIPQPYKKALSAHNKKVAVMFQVSYNMPEEDIRNAADQGYFIIKIKTGQPGSQSEMLAKDMARLSQVHAALKDKRTGQTPDGKLIYTLDSNARYEKKETLLRLLDHADKIGALPQILFVEEPLSESNHENVGDIGVRMAADESVHTEQDAIRRLDQGYQGLVLKGIAKSLSLSMKIAKLAYERNVPCLCADQTVNPILVDWNKNLAARLQPFPGLDMGMIETNGDMNYVNWKTMCGYHPYAGSGWTEVRNGVFELNEDYYKKSGGIFAPSSHYRNMFRKNG